MDFLPRNKKLRLFSSQLRNGATRQENHLWYDFLRTYPLRFNRQRIIGNFIVDFYCEKAKLIIELDGSQHFEPTGQEKDRERDAFLQGLGLTVLRFSNAEVDRNFEAVCRSIDREVQNAVGRQTL